MARGVNGSPLSNKTSWHVTYNSVYLGLVDGADLSNLKRIRDAITTGTTGKTILGHREHGVQGSIKVMLRQIDVAQCGTCAPWWSGTGAIPLSPPAGSDSYSYAHVLLFHPEGAGDTTQDVSFPLATPSSIPLVVRDGVKEDVFPVEFDIYPSRSAMASDLTAVTPGTVLNA